MNGSRELVGSTWVIGFEWAARNPSRTGYEKMRFTSIYMMYKCVILQKHSDQWMFEALLAALATRKISDFAAVGIGWFCTTGTAPAGRREGRSVEG